MMNVPVTEQVYAFICAYQREHGYPPTQREIAKNCYLAHSSVGYHLDRLEDEGRILREPGRARGITLLH